MKRILALLSAIFLYVTCWAQGSFIEGYNASYLDVYTGLPNNFVEDIYEDSYGFVWIATRGGGLVRYDGYTYHYYSFGRQVMQAKSNSCRNIYEDRFHRLWVAYDEFLDVFDLNTMTTVEPKCTTLTLTAMFRRLKREACVRVYRDQSGKMWVITASHIYRIGFDEEGIISDIKGMSYTSNTPDIAIEDVAGDGSVLVAYGGTLHRVAPSGRRLLSTDLRHAYPQVSGFFVTDIIRYNGNIFLATNNGLYSGDPQFVLRHGGSGPSLSHDYVSALAVTADNRLLIGTLRGVDILDGKTGRLEHWNAGSQPKPLCSDFVNCIFTIQGQVWVGTEAGGITKLVPRVLQFKNYVHTSDPTSLSPNAVNAIYAAPDGTVWVGTVEGGLNRKAKGANGFDHFTTANSGLSHNSVSTLAADGQGRLWVGTWGGGVCVMDMRNPATLRRLTVDAAHADRLMFTGAMAYDPINKGMWIGCNEGVYFYRFDTNNLEEPFRDCRNIRGCIGSVVTDDGFLLMGCTEGMVRIDLRSRPTGKGQFKTRQLRYKLDNQKSGILDKIMAFCKAKDGTIWMGSNGYGLYRMTYDAKRRPVFKSYTTEDGLPNNVVKGIAEGHDGLLWVTTAHGLSRFDPRTGSFNNFDESEGLVSSEFYFNSAVSTPGGRLYLGTVKGLVELDGESKAAPYHGQLRFTSLKINNQEVGVGEGYLDTDISIARKIRLHESDKSFTIDFAALNYGSETQGVYSYRMKGLEDDWVQLPPGQHSVRYSSLTGGNYEFQVKYSPSLATGKAQTISIEIHVTPYFWKSWWFFTLLIISGAAAAYVIYKRRMQLMREAEAEKLYRPIEAALKESENPSMLQTRIQNILNNEQRYKESQAKSVMADKEAVARSTKPFMEQVMAVLEANFSSSEFGPNELSEKMGMSRNVLNKKLNAEIGFTSSQFIRNYRLDFARKLLAENFADRNITEIAYKSGFNDPKYFTRCFTKQYGTSPSNYRAEG